MHLLVLAVIFVIVVYRDKLISIIVILNNAHLYINIDVCTHIHAAITNNASASMKKI